MKMNSKLIGVSTLILIIALIIFIYAANKYFFEPASTTNLPRNAVSTLTTQNAVSNNQASTTLIAPFRFSINQTKFDFEKNSIKNPVNADIVTFSSGISGMIPGYNVVLNGSKIGRVSGYEQTEPVFSPNNDYVSFETVGSTGNYIQEGINIIDFKNHKVLYVQTPPVSDLHSEEYGIIESYNWDAASDAINVDTFAVKFQAEGLYRVTPKQIWRYDLLNQKYTLVQTLPE